LGQIHALWSLEGLGQVNLQAIEGALQSDHSYVLESAIRLSGKLPDQEQAGLMPVFEQLAESSDLVVLRELAASLGQVPSAAALELL